MAENIYEARLSELTKLTEGNSPEEKKLILAGYELGYRQGYAIGLGEGKAVGKSEGFKAGQSATVADYEGIGEEAHTDLF